MIGVFATRVLEMLKKNTRGKKKRFFANLWHLW
jgi:hypothetical protein